MNSIKIKFKTVTLLAFLGLIGSFLFASAQTTQVPDYSESYPNQELLSELPDPDTPPLDPCANPEREPRFVYRERVVHEERQFRAEHTGCGGDIMMRQWQVVGLEIGRCDGGPNEDCNDPEWMDEFVYYYDRYTPNQDGEIFDEVGSWQKAWPSSGQWLTEEEMLEKYGEPIPFPTCQSDCLQAPPGVPGQVGDFGQEDPYYFNNPWLPDLIGGETPLNIEHLREKNILGGSNPLRSVSLPTKLFWWNIPGWHEGWIENGELRSCDNDDPENIACVDSYILRLDNINREDRPAKFHRHEVVNRLIDEAGLEYRDAHQKYEEIIDKNHRAYERYRRSQDDVRGIIDVIRYDRDNIIGCDECGREKEIWLDTNTFNPLEFDPKYDYERSHREWMKDWLVDQFEDATVKEIIEDTYKSYGRPSFFRSGAEHSYSLQAACAPHDYLEEGEGWRGPEATFSFETSDAPELISPIDPNWTSPYDPKEYDPNFDPSRLQTEKYGYEDGYRYPAEIYPGKGGYVVDPGTGELVPPEPEDPEPAEGEDILKGPNVDQNNPGMECSQTNLNQTSIASEDLKDAVGVGGRTNLEVYTNWLMNEGVSPTLAQDIATGGTSMTRIPPVFEDDPTHCWRKILDTAEIVDQVGNYGTTSIYRDRQNNTFVGSRSTTSFHMRNNAIDLQRTGENGPNQQLYCELENLLPESKGRLWWYPKTENRGSFVHIDTRTHTAPGERSQSDDFCNNLAQSSYGLAVLQPTLSKITNDRPAAGGHTDYMPEERGLSSWRTDQLKSIWDQDPNSLILQDQVAFREELEWSQPWYQEDVSDRPRPARKFLMSFGEGIRVTRETVSEYGDPVLEDCHGQLISEFDGNPICTYRERPAGTHETYLQYAAPNHLDREMEFFTLPEDPERDVYSWNIASCRDSAGTDCTNFSQMWRFQLDEREEEQLLPPKNTYPLNKKLNNITTNQATVGFPFGLGWDRRFGARTYVYRLRQKGDSWDEVMDAKVQRGNQIYYSLDDLNNPSYYPFSSSLFDLDTAYEWDVKACWDDGTDHDKEDPNEILEWAEENKDCSRWRSEQFPDAPFQFRTTGRPPQRYSPGIGDDATYPFNLEWENVPGSESYILEFYKNPFLGNEEFAMGAVLPDSEFDFFMQLPLNIKNDWNITTCADQVDNIELYYPQAFDGLDFIYGDKDDLDDRREELKCGEKGIDQWLTPKLSIPETLFPGTNDSSSPEEISIDDSIRTLRWRPVAGAEAYKVTLNSSGASSLIPTIHAFFEKEIITEDTYITYNLEDLGEGSHFWTVRACLSEDCQKPSFCTGEDETCYMSEASERSYIKLYTPSNPFSVKGIVPCGRNENIFTEEYQTVDGSLDSTEDCRPIHLFVMIGLIIEEILVKMIIPYSLVVLLLYTGYLYYVSLGKPETMQRVIKMWKYAFRGYLLILLSWIIVGVFLTLIGYQFGAWWQITI